MSIRIGSVPQEALNGVQKGGGGHAAAVALDTCVVLTTIFAQLGGDELPARSNAANAVLVRTRAPRRRLPRERDARRAEAANVRFRRLATVRPLRLTWTTSRSSPESSSTRETSLT